ncbi:MAG: MFS transporter [Chloroflexi bacterium]|nr:MFS transporter [Chloroflexota bacterium]
MQIPRRPRNTANPVRFLRNTLRSSPALRNRDLRVLMSASFFDAIGFMGEQVVLSWLILDLTDNPFMVGVSLALRMVPLFFLGIPAGTIADMVDRRLLIRLLNMVMALLLVGIGALIYLDMLQVWHLLAFAVVGGCMSAMHQAARQSFAFDVAGRENLVTGLAYVGLGMRLGGLAGSIAAGYLIDGPGAHMAYWMLAGGYIVSTLLLSFIRSPGQAAARSRQPMMQNLREFAGELRRNNPLLTLVVIVAATEMLGFSSGAALPSLARDVLDVGAEGLGWLNGFRSGGAVVAILLLSLFGEVGRKGLLLLLNIVLFGAALILLGQSSALSAFLSGGGIAGELILGQSPAFVIALLATGIIGGAMALSDIFSQSMMQNIVPNEQRGRAMGAWIVGIGTAPVGNLQVGAVIGAAGVGLALSANGIALALVGVAIFALYGRMRRM